MKTFNTVTMSVCLSLVAVGWITPADAATSSKALTVSAIVTTTCKLTQDHDNLFSVTSHCTNGADFSAASFVHSSPLIQKGDSGMIVIF
ncbi:hypothetical protein [Herbaspirillum sp. alder98]|uniref:hypothetical protein n=1 Tax=Herbaspirillum sp. alder98 TaxID=2913096 RepID=UPI001CD8BA05|nr:hypothetical protein [Herbaspirillum sp. alder98]MCA1322874.1 hypothetical protein [Herbaspirillum sp. alder98]